MHDFTQVEGLIRLMEGDHVGPFNLGNPGEFTMLELAEVSLKKKSISNHENSITFG